MPRTESDEPGSLTGDAVATPGELAADVERGRPAYRVGYSPDPWGFTPWEYATDGRFSGRFDDPDGVYRTLYVGASPLTCLLEVLAKFRPDPAVVAALSEISAEHGPELYPTPKPGAVPASWIARRSLGTASLTGTFADIGAKESLPLLRTALARWLVHYGVTDLDGAAIRSSVPRGLTQHLSRLVNAATTPDGQAWDGIVFESRHGNDLLLWAIFERPSDQAHSSTLENLTALPIDDGDAALTAALRLHGLHIMA